MPVRGSGVRVAVAVAAWTLALPGHARADEKSECIDAHKHAQELRQAGQLRAARAALMTCAADACPALVKRDCAQWVQDVGAAVPSVVVEARDEQGRETTNVEVLVDGDRVADHLDGRAIEVDPGEHLFQFRSRTGVVLDQRAVVREGEHMRRLVADFERHPPPPAPVAAPIARPPMAPEPSRGSVLPWVLGGVSVIGVAGFATFAILGKSKQGELEDCKPTCSLDEVGVMRTRYLVADIALGTAIVAGGLALYFAVSSRSPAKHGSARTAP